MRKILFSPVFIILFSLVIGLILISLYRQSFDLKGNRQELLNLQNKKQGLADDLANLEEKLKQESYNQEKIIRDQLLMQKADEYVVKIELEEVAPAESRVTTKLSPWEEWRKVLF